MDYNELAENYREVKSHTIENLLKAGKIITTARHSLSHGQFYEWLNDLRVNESIRTAQRFMTIYKDFGHILEHKDKMEALNTLGVTNLLALKKLPDRFRKEIEIVYNNPEGEETREIKKVIDEEKLEDFLDTTVEYNGKPTLIKDLPVPELHKEIKKAQGIYEPESFDYDRKEPVQETTLREGECLEPEVVNNSQDPVRVVSEMLSSLLDLSNNLFVTVDKIDESVLMSSSDRDIEEMKIQISQFKSNVEAIYVKLNNLLDKCD